LSCCLVCQETCPSIPLILSARPTTDLSPISRQVITPDCVVRAALKGPDYVYLWKHLLAEAKVDLLFINSGAHVHHLPFFRRLVDDTVAYLKVGATLISECYGDQYVWRVGESTRGARAPSALLPTPR
jgi:hypothetical protein